MAIRLLTSYLFLLIYHSSISQLKVIDINLDKSNSKVEIIADSSFYIEKKTTIVIKYSGDGTISRVINSEGKVKLLAKNYYSVSFPDSTKSVATLIKVFERTPKGKQRLVLSKPYNLKRIPPPLITIGGVKSDSSINIEHLFRDNYIRSFDSVNKIPLQTHSFTINFSETDTVRIRGNKIPLKVKPKIYNLIEGRELRITNVHTVLQDNNIYITPILNVFLIKNDQYTVGERKYIKD